MADLNDVARDILRRPISEGKKFYELPIEQWIAVRKQLSARLEEENRLPVLSADIDRMNFLLCGVPVVIQEMANG